MTIITNGATATASGTCSICSSTALPEPNLSESRKNSAASGPVNRCRPATDRSDREQSERNGVAIRSCAAS